MNAEFSAKRLLNQMLWLSIFELVLQCVTNVSYGNGGTRNLLAATWTVSIATLEIGSLSRGWLKIITFGTQYLKNDDGVGTFASTFMAMLKCRTVFAKKTIMVGCLEAMSSSGFSISYHAVSLEILYEEGKFSN